MHSFWSGPRYPGDPAGPWPEACLGTDAFHTPRPLFGGLREAFLAEGLTVAENLPFAGCYVPLPRYGKDPRVAGIMVELRRDLCCDEATGEPSAGLGALRTAFRRAYVAGLAGWWDG